MPLYDFKCSKCGHVFESLEKHTITYKKCPKCKKRANKVLGSFSFKVNGHNVGNGYARKESVIDKAPK